MDTSYCLYPSLSWIHSESHPCVDRAPTNQGPVCTHCAGLGTTCTDVYEQTHRRDPYVIPPTGQRTICAYAAIEFGVGTDRHERSCRSVRLAKVIETPAGHGTVGTHTACVACASADRSEQSRRCIRLTVVVPTPADHGAVRSDAASVLVTGTDRSEQSQGCTCLAVGRSAPSRPRCRQSARRKCVGHRHRGVGTVHRH